MHHNSTCPHCGPVRSKVVNIRPHDRDGLRTVRRTRRCFECGQNWFTLEIDETEVNTRVRTGILNGLRALTKAVENGSMK